MTPNCLKLQCGPSLNSIINPKWRYYLVVTVISYAQNFEDVMLWRCFGHLKSGFYIDVGAEDPINDSVTKMFYDKGWCGINIEPTEFSFLKLKVNRPRDTNIQIAISETSGILDFWVVPSTGLSTGVEKFANKHKAAGLEVRLDKVESETLEAVCEEYSPTVIHFMKIDVEGFEREVLSSANFVKFRPMVILVESTEPNSKVENFEKWEQILLNQRYDFCYADGLNRFYLANEANYLKSHFDYPPNVFDDFVLHTDSRAKSVMASRGVDTKSDSEDSKQRTFLENQVLTASNLSDVEKKRILMTVNCRDSDPIPKISNAGDVVIFQDQRVQLMHNGVMILEDCYYGPWMTHIIKILRGHHEPQEEIIFHEILQYLQENPSTWGNPRMIELGSFWAYYSMWFLKNFPSGNTYCIEPDPDYLRIGEENFALNNLGGVFIQAQVSNVASPNSQFWSNDGELITIPSFDFDAILAATGHREIDLVLVDIQGAEIALLENLSEVLQNSIIRFMLISTHDLEISGSAITHQSALHLLIENGAHILSEHSVSESYSGDGFILASFNEADKNLQIPISYNRSRNSLFGEWEPRMHNLKIELLQKFAQQHDQLAQQHDQLAQQHDQLAQQHDQLAQQHDGLLNSTIWKLTKPLRVIIDLFKK